MKRDRIEAKREAATLREPVAAARELAERMGLDPYPVRYWVVDHDEMNELIAYEGFQRRYPHWRWGMNYDRQRKKDQFGLGKAFEIVNNDDPSHAFLQESNSLADQKAVVTHVEAHADFFANNRWFGLYADRGAGGPDAAATLERHADAIEGYMRDPDIEREDVERLIDAVLTVTDTIDQHRPLGEAPDADSDADIAGGVAGDESDDAAALADRLDDLDLSDDVRRQVFDDDWLAEHAGGDGVGEPRADVLAYLRDHGRRFDSEEGKAVDREPWETHVIDMLREEAYYFAAQKMTKIMNEGWACVAPDTPVFTGRGLVPMREVVEDHVPVSDGETTRTVYDSNVIPDHDTVTITTRRGFELTGSNNHRVRRPGGSWVRLDELSAGDEIEITGGNGLWPDEYVRVDWEPSTPTTLEDAASEAGVSVWTAMRYRDVGRAEKGAAVEAALAGYDGEDQSAAQGDRISVPGTVDESFGRFLGLVVGDGHVSEASNQVGFTAGSKAKAEEVAGIATELFDVSPTVSEAGPRWRTYIYSANLVRLLRGWAGLETGATEKIVPDAVQRSPRSVVAEFLRGLFDADGHAGDQGVVLSTKSEAVGRTVQLLLANFGILSRRRRQTDGCYHVHLTGESARTFRDEIGFGYSEKASALDAYLDDLAWFQDESWTDEVTEVSEGSGTVYDVSVADTHRYAGGGVLNHNSYWESRMMSDEGFAGVDELFTYADHMARVLGSPGLNPYKLGMELWEHIETTTNRREVIDRLLRIEGIGPDNFHDEIDFDRVAELIAPDPAIAGAGPETLDDLAELAAAGDPRVDADNVERARAAVEEGAGEEDGDGGFDVERYPWKLLTYEGLAERHYSLARPQNRGAVERVTRAELEETARYMFDDDRYPDAAAALEGLDYAAGWDRMREIRASHNDVTFVDAFLTDEFVREGGYFTYEYAHAGEEFRVASTDADDVRRKLLLQFTNFGKPTIAVYDGNFRNRRELLLGHQYNGVALDVEQARATLERVFELWGRPVNLMTIRTEYEDHELEIARRRNREPEGTEVGIRIRYDGDGFTEHELEPELRERIDASEVDYDTTPDEWLA